MSKRATITLFAITISIIVHFLFVNSVNAEDTSVNLCLSDIEMTFADKQGRNAQFIEKEFYASCQGSISLSEPFRIPCYNPDTNGIMTAPDLWDSIVYLDEQPIAILTMSYINGSIIFRSILYLPDSISKSIECGNNLSFFLYDGISIKDDYAYCYAIDNNGDIHFLFTDDNKFDEKINYFHADKDDYILLSKINTINSSLNKKKLYEYTPRNKKAILKNRSHQTLIIDKYSIFTLRSYQSDRKQVIISPFSDESICFGALNCQTWDIQCIQGGIKPKYIISLSDKPNMVLTFDGNFTSVKRYSAENNQIWNIEFT